MLVERQIGNYRLLRLLGQGGFADVYLGEHVHLNRLAAIKLLRPQLGADDISSFRAEARTIAHLAHPNIVSVLEFGVEGHTPFLVMDYAPNGTLRQRHPRGVVLAPEIVVTYVKQVAAALQYAHDQKVIHRDIKQENMLLGRNNEVLLSDFGIAFVTQSMRAQSMLAANASDATVGTIAYMAPEQIQGKPSPASDQYSLAVVVYEWLCGVRPFNGSPMEIAAQQMHAPAPSMSEKIPTLSPDIERVVMTALAKDPRQRFRSVQAFANAFEQACQDTFRIPLSSQSSLLSNAAGDQPIEAVLHGPSGRTMLGPTICIIGRAQDCQLVINDPKASFHHAEIRPGGGGQGYSVTDLGSMNGTFVNEQRLTPNIPRLLNQGDAIRIGDTTLTYVVSSVQPMGGVSSPLRADAGAHTGYGGMPQPYPPQQAWAPPSPPTSSSTIYTPSDGSGTIPPPPLQPPYGQPMMPGGTNNAGAPPFAQQSSYTPLVYPPPPSQQQKRSPVRAIVLAVIALVIILAGVGSFFIYHNNQVALNNSHATATAQTSHNNATATAQAHLNATATVFASATAIATSNYRPFTKVAFYDALTASSDSQWSSSSACQASSNGYQVSIAQNNVFEYCSYLTGTFGDFAYQATMNIQQGDCGGLIFRHIDNQNYFLFEVCKDGTYNLSARINNQWNSLYPSLHASSAIQQGLNQQNVIAITVQGNTENMYVNGKNIDSATDEILTSSVFSQGKIALEADDRGDPTTVIYTNALVWTTSS